jgi:hypothetical protein
MTCQSLAFTFGFCPVAYLHSLDPILDGKIRNVLSGSIDISGYFIGTVDDKEDLLGVSKAWST